MRFPEDRRLVGCGSGSFLAETPSAYIIILKIQVVSTSETTLALYLSKQRTIQEYHESDDTQSVSTVRSVKFFLALFSPTV